MTALVVIFPRFVAPFGAHHSDMYIAPDLAAAHFPLGRLLLAPRPIALIVAELAGFLGLEGSIAAALSIALFDLALAVFVLERYILHKRVPVWICFLTFLLATSAPGAYINAGYDWGTALAMLFAFLGIIAWESRGPSVVFAGALCTLLFILSVLSKEGFVPILVLYAAAASWKPRERADRLVAVFVFVALVCISMDAKFISHSTFLSSNSDSNAPYYVSFAPSVVIGSIQYYFGPLFSQSLVLMLVLAIVLAFVERRGRIALALLFGGLSLQVPYLILPNHRLGYYWWVTVPVLMLLVPLALTPSPGTAGAISLRGARARKWLAVGVVCVLLLSVRQYESIDVASEQWFVVQQRINETMIRDLRRHRNEIRSAHNVLVAGLTFPFHPWSHGYFIGKELRYRGQWTVATSPGQQPVATQLDVSPIDYADIRFSNYDLALVFDGSGHLVGAYPPDQVERYAHPESGISLGPWEVVQYLQTHGPAPSGKIGQDVIATGDAASSAQLPAGILANGVDTPSGIYRPDGTMCCWVGSSATFDVAAPRGARTLALTVFVPDSIPAGAAPTELLIRSKAGQLFGSAHLHFGTQTVTVRIPAQVTAGEILVRVEPNKVFVPKDLGLNGDVRKMSLVLQNVSLE